MSRSLSGIRRLALALLAPLFAFNLAPQAGAQPPTPGSSHGSVYLPLVRGGTGKPAEPQVRLVPDSVRAVHAVVGPEGSLLKATAADGTRFELLIAADALDFVEPITMTPALRAEELPLSGGLLGAVKLEPEHLELHTPALLRIIPPELPPGLRTIAFAYNGDGEQFHLRPIAVDPAANGSVPDAPVLAMALPALRSVGVGSGTQADVERQLARPAPADPLDALEQQLVADTPDELHTLGLLSVYQVVIWPGLQRAVTDDRAVDLAIRRFGQWLFWVDHYKLRTRLITQISDAFTQIKRIVARSAAASFERCVAERRPEEGFRLLRLARYARTYVSAAEDETIRARLAKCLRFELTFHSHMTEGGFGDPYGYLYGLEAKLTLRAGTGKGTTATGSGPLEWREVGWIGSNTGGCVFSVTGTGSTFNAQPQPFGLSIAPVGRSSPAVTISLWYHPGTPSELTSIQCPGGIVTAPTTAWATYYGQTHADERSGAGYRVSSQVVGAGSFAGWAYHLTTSGPSGQAVIEDTNIAIVHAPER